MLTMFAGKGDDDATGLYTQFKGYGASDVSRTDKAGATTNYDIGVNRTLTNATMPLATQGYEQMLEYLTNTDKLLSNSEALAVQIDDSFQNIVNIMGQGSQLGDAMKNNFSQAAISIIEMGGSLDDAEKLATSTLEVLGRNVTLNEENYEQLFATQKVTGENADKILEGFLDAGKSIKDINDEMLTVLDTANALGVNAKAVSKLVVGNMEQLNRFGFQGGIEGLARMAAQAQVLRIDMQSTFDLADDLLSPEKSIEMAAALQRLGAVSSDLTDPLRLMDLAQNNVPELQNQLGQLFKQYTVFDEKTKQFQIAPGARRLIKQLHDDLGIPIKDIERMALGTADMDKKLSEISFSGLDIDEDTQKMVANMAVMGEGGEYVIETKDAEGNPVTKSIQEFLDDFGGDQSAMKKFLEDRSAEAEMTTEEKMLKRADDQLSALKDIDATLKGATISEALSLGGSKALSSTLELNRQLVKQMNDPIIQNFGPDSPLYGTFNKAGKSIEDLATKIEKGEPVSKADFERILTDFKDVITTGAQKAAESVWASIGGLGGMIGVEVPNFGQIIQQGQQLLQQGQLLLQGQGGGQGQGVGQGQGQGGGQGGGQGVGNTSQNLQFGQQTIQPNVVFPDNIQISEIQITTPNMPTMKVQSVDLNLEGQSMADFFSKQGETQNETIVNVAENISKAAENNQGQIGGIEMGPALASNEGVVMSDTYGYGPMGIEGFRPEIYYPTESQQTGTFQKEIQNNSQIIQQESLLDKSVREIQQLKIESEQQPIRLGGPKNEMGENKNFNPNVGEEEGKDNEGGGLGLFKILGNAGDIFKNINKLYDMETGQITMDPEVIASMIEKLGDKIGPELAEISKIQDKGEQTKALQELMQKFLTVGNAAEIVGAENKYKGKFEEGAGINEAITEALRNSEGLTGGNIEGITEMLNSNMGNIIDSVTGAVKDNTKEGSFFGNIIDKFSKSSGTEFDRSLIDSVAGDLKEMAQYSKLDSEQLKGVFEGKQLDITGSMGMMAGMYPEYDFSMVSPNVFSSTPTIPPSQYGEIPRGDMESAMATHESVGAVVGETKVGFSNAMQINVNVTGLNGASSADVKKIFTDALTGNNNDKSLTTAIGSAAMASNNIREGNSLKYKGKRY